ncbi:MAG: hypothetical protein AB1757_05855 [Acidobacteriota bacterium]
MGNLPLTPELAKQILAEAAARGLSVEALLESVIEKNRDALDEDEETHFQRRATSEEWIKALREFAQNFPQKAPPLSDYAVSRESIYAEREERQL